MSTRVETTDTRIRQVREERRGDAPLFVHPDWENEFAWLVQGTTPREAGSFASFGNQPAESVHAQWRNLRTATGMRCAAFGHQVHGARILTHDNFADGWLIADKADGHITRERGLLLAVSIADCVPVFVIDPNGETVAILHAGWRGVAAGILHNCIAMMSTDVRVHFGPSICGECYEVGPEVHVALGLPEPEKNTPVDLRAVLAQQAIELGIQPDAITTSAWCTRCNVSPFFSHRAGHPERQVAVIGIR